MRVYVDMVADLLHAGHIAFLRKVLAAAHEEEAGLQHHLVIGIHSDSVVASYKRAPICTMEERICVVAALALVDEVLPDAPLHVSADFLAAHELDLVFHGDDLSDAMKERMYGEVIARGKFRTVQYTEGISTTALLERASAHLDKAKSTDRRGERYATNAQRSKHAPL